MSVMGAHLRGRWGRAPAIVPHEPPRVAATVAGPRRLTTTTGLR